MSVTDSLRHALVVSCQPVEAGPLDDDEVVARLAHAAVLGGAKAIRVDAGLKQAARLAHVRHRIEVPIIGIVKRDLSDSPVRITPYIRDVLDLAKAGADIIAVDVTQRVRPVRVSDLLSAIHDGGRVAMADASNLEDAMAAADMGFDIIGTTLSGYTGGPVPGGPDLALVRTLAAHGLKVMAEGRFNTPSDVAKAITAGAWAVTVGSALTRLEVMTSWFAEAIAASVPRAIEAPMAHVG